MSKNLLSINEAAARLGVSAKTLRRWEAAGKLKPIRTLGNQRRYSLSELKALTGTAKVKIPRNIHQQISQQASSTPIIAPVIVPSEATPVIEPIAQPQIESYKITETFDIPTLEDIELQKEKNASEDLNTTGHSSFFHFSQLSLRMGVSLLSLVGGLLVLGLANWVIVSNHFEKPEAFLAKFITGAANEAQEQVTSSKKKNDVLADTDVKNDFALRLNVPAEFMSTASIAGTLTAPNIVYSLIAGDNITITGDPQTPIVSAALSIEAGTGLNISNGVITNTDAGSSQKIFSNLKVGSNTITAGNNNDTIEFAAGSGISLSTDTTNKKLTITNSSSGNTLAIEESDVGVVSTATTLDLLGGDFDVSESPSGEANIQLAATLASVTGVAGAFTVGSSLTVGGDAISDFTGSNTGITVSSGTLSLITSCVDGQLLEYTSGGGWACADDDTTAGSSISKWELENGILRPINNTVDLLIGGTATTAAKFAVTGVNGSATPVATLSAGLAGGAFLSANGTLATTAKQTLTLGDGNTGNLALGISGFTTCTALETIGGILTCGTDDTGASTSYWQLQNGALSPFSETLDFLIGGTATNSAEFAITGIADGSPVASLSAGISGGLSISNNGTIATTARQSLTLGDANTGNIVINSGTGLITLSDATTAESTFTATGTLTANGTLAANGVVTLGDGGDAVTIDSNALILQTTGAGSDITLNAVDQIILSDFANCSTLTTVSNNLTCGTADGASNWNVINGTIQPKLASTLDLLIGGATTTSAKFAFTNVNNGVPTASISAITSQNALSLDASGAIFTTNKQTLSLGTTSTGNILIGSDATARDITIGSATTTGLSLTDDNWSITPAGVATFTQTNTDNLQLDGNTLTVTNASGNLTLDVAGGDAAGEDLIISAHNLQLAATGALTISPDAALTTAIDLTDTNLTNAISLADNNITGTAFSILAASGALTLDATTTVALDGSTSITLSDSGSNYAIFTESGAQNFQINTIGGTVIIANGDDLHVYGDAIGLNNDADAENLIALSAAGGDPSGNLFWGNRTLCDSSGNCGGSSKWTQNDALGLLYPNNNTLDFLIGGVSTAAAKFAITGVNGSNTPVATLSAGLAGGAYLTAAGNLATTAKQSLTLGSSDTGEIVLSGFASGIIRSTNGVLSSSAVDLASSDVTGVLPIANGGTNKALTISNGGIIWSDADSFEVLAANANAGLALVSGGGATPSWFAPTTGSVIFSGANGALSQDNSSFFFDDTNNRLGLGTTTPGSTLDVRGFTSVNGGTLPVASLSGSTSFASLVVDNSGAGDLFTASSSGLERFSIKNNGTIQLSTVPYNNCTALETVNGLLTCGTDDTGATANYWQSVNTGTIATHNETVDLLVGGVGTASAEFAVTGIAAGTPVATLSAISNNTGLSLNASEARIQSLNMGTLTLGGASTGNIVLDSGSGLITLSDTTSFGGTASITTAGVGTGFTSFTVDNIILDGTTIGHTSDTDLLSLASGALTINGTGTFTSTLAVQGTSIGLDNDSDAENLIALSAAGGDPSGNLFWGNRTLCDSSGNCGGSSKWTQNDALGLLYPNNNTLDFLIGGVSTAAAKFAITGVNGSNTPVASLSAGLSGGAFLSANGTLATTARQSLTLGDSNTGNIVLDSGSGLITLNDNTTIAGDLTVTGGDITGANGETIDIGEATNGTITFAATGGVNNNNIEFDLESTNYPIITSGASALGINADVEFVGNHVLTGTGNLTIDTVGNILLSDFNNCNYLYTATTTLTCGTGTVGSNWNVVNGTIQPKLASTLDLLLGGVSTASAKFAVTGINGSATPVASLSAGLAGGVYLSANGTLATTANQSLTLGDADTGDIVLSGFASGIIRSTNGALSSSSINLAAGSADITGTLGVGNGGTGNASLDAGALFFGAGGNTALNTLTIGSANTCLLSTGTAPTWGTCALGTNYWQSASSGTITPYITGVDTLFGGVSTASATLRIAGSVNAGTNPVASVAGNTTYSAFVVDNRGTGDLFTASSGGISRFTITQAGNVGIGTATPARNLEVASITTTSFMKFNPTTSDDWSIGAEPLGFVIYDDTVGGNPGYRMVIDSSGRVALGGGLTPSDTLEVTSGGAIIGSDAHRLISNGLSVRAGATDQHVAEFFGQDSSYAGFLVAAELANSVPFLQFADNAGASGALANGVDWTMTSENSLFHFRAGNAVATSVLSLSNTGSVGIGTSTHQAALDVRGNTGTTPAASISANSTFAGLIVDNTTGDLFTASAAGMSRFTITQNGNIYTNGIVGQTINSAACVTTTNGIVTGSGTCQGGLEPWQIANGAAYLGNTTLDLLVGGATTASARFAIKGINDGTPIATLSASNNQGLYLDAANSAIQSVRKNTLTLGGDTTGNIAFRPNNGGSTGITSFTGRVGIGTTTPVYKLGIVGDTDSLANGPLYIEADGATNTIGTALTLNATPVGGHSWSFLSTGSGAGAGAGHFAVYDGTADSYRFDIDSNGKVGIGSNIFNQRATLDVRGNTAHQPIASFSGQTSAATLVLDQRGLGDILAASSSGFDRFVIRNNGNTEFNSGLDANLGTWNAASETLPVELVRHATIFANGYIYILGGRDGNDFDEEDSVYYTKVNSNGSVGPWITSSNPLPESIEGLSAVSVNGYIYVMGGYNGTTTTSTVYSAKINADGSVGAWRRLSDFTGGGREMHMSFTANGYIYIIGDTTSVLYAKANPDGTTSAWQTTTSIVGGERHGVVAVNGFVYVIAGGSNDLYYARINADGTLSSFITMDNVLPESLSSATAVAANGYLYLLGGYDVDYQDTVHYARVNADGSVGTWMTDPRRLPEGRFEHTSIIANGYIYLLGGSNGLYNTNVWYSSTARVSMLASLDLIGLTNASLSSTSGELGMGSLGGSIFAGNIFSNANLEIIGATRLWGPTLINNALTAHSIYLSGYSGTTPSASISAQSSFAGMVVDNSGPGDLFTASAAGMSRFTIANNGVIYTNGTAGVTVTGNSCVTTVNGIVTGSGTCQLGNEPWQIANGAAYLGNTTIDMLVGGTTTSSAKFSLTNINGSASPIASLSATTTSGGNGNGIVLGANGSIQSLLNSTLTIGGDTTGNIILSGRNGTSNSIYFQGYNCTGSNGGTLTVNSAGLVQCSDDDAGAGGGITTIQEDDGDVVTGAETIDFLGSDFTVGASGTEGNISIDYGNSAITRRNNAEVIGGQWSFLSDILAGGTSTASAKFAVLNMMGSGTPTASLSAGVAGGAYLTATGALSTTNKQTLTLGDFDNTGNINVLSEGNYGRIDNYFGLFSPIGFSVNQTVAGERFSISGYGQVGINLINSTTNPALAALDLRAPNSIFGGTQPVASISGRTSFAGLIVDNSVGDIFTASASGLSRFTITQSGGIVTNGSAGVTVDSNSCVTTTNGIVTGSGTCQLGNEPWQIANGSAYLGNTTLDLLVGGTTTASANFAITGINNDAPVATLSAGLAGGAYLTATGTLATTANQSLTLGDADTGNIVLSGFASGIIRSTGGVLSSSTVDLASSDVTGVLPIANGGTNKALTLSNGGIIWSDADSFEVLAANANSGLALVSGGAGAPTWFAPTTGSVIFSGANGALSQDNSSFFFDDTNNRLGLGTTTPGSTLDVRGFSSVNGGTLPVASLSGSTSFASLIVDNTIGDLFTASQGGITRFVITPTGNLQFTGNTNVLSTLNSAATSAQTYTLPSLGGTLCIQESSSCGFALGTNYWQSANAGSITPYITGVDTLFGGVSTASATLRIAGSVNAGTNPVASIAGNTTSAALIVDNRGSGDLFTASSAGLSRFTIRQNGDVQFETDGSTLYFGAGGDPDTHVGEDPTNDRLLLFGRTGINLTTNNGNGGVAINQNGGVTINTDQDSSGGFAIKTQSTSTLFLVDTNSRRVGIGVNGASNLGATLDVSASSATVAIASFSGSTNYAALLVDNTGAGDLFTASQGGITRFVITPTGNLQFTGNTNVLSTLNSAATSVQTYTLPSLGGTLCIQGSSSCGFALGTNFWQSANPGSITPYITGVDTLFGGVSTASATLRIAGSVNAGTNPVASIGGQTNYAALVVDQRGIGDIFAASSGGISRFVIKQNGNIGIGAAFPTAQLQIANPNSGTTNTLSTYVSAAGSARIDSTGTSNLLLNFATGNTVAIGGAGGSGGADSGLNVYGDTSSRRNNDSATAFRVYGSISGGSQPAFTVSTDGLNPGASIAANTTYAGLVVDQRGTGDLFTASSGGITRFTIKQNGDITIGSLTYTFPSSQGTDYILQNNGSGVLSWIDPGSLPNSDKWDSTLGALYPKNASVLDLLVGGIATSAAKFAVLNVNGSATPIASLSATTASSGNGNGIVLNANGSIQTLRNNTLTIGGDTTGDIILSPRNGDGSLIGDDFKFRITADAFDRFRFYNSVNNSTLRLTTNDSTSTTGLEIYHNAGAYYGFTGYNNGVMRITGGTNIPLSLGADDSDFVRLTTTGRLGISTTTPFATLEVAPNIIGGGTLAVASTSGRTSFASLVVDNTLGDLFTASSSGLNRFVIKQNGNVGIGTTLPTEKLEVVGNTKISANALVTTAAATTSADQVITSVDSGNVGSPTSLAIGADGLPVISYTDAFGQIKLVKCGNTACSSGNTVTTADSDGSHSYSALAIGTDGLPIIAYYLSGGGLELHVRKCGNATCSFGTETIVDTTGDVGKHPSIAIGNDGLPVISYYDETNDDLKVLKCGNASCSSGNADTTVDSSGLVGLYTSITIGTDGLPVIAYFDDTNNNLKVVKCGNSYCNTSNTITTVDTTSTTTGSYPSIAIGTDGLPVISFARGVNLGVAKCGNTACSAGNTVTTVDSTGVTFNYTSIAIGTDGLPVISSYDTTNTRIKVAKCTNISCSLGATITAVDSTSDTGLYTSIAIGTDGLPVISYHDNTDDDLKVVRCSDAACSGAVSSPLIGGSDLGTINAPWRSLYFNTLNLGRANARVVLNDQGNFFANNLYAGSTGLTGIGTVSPLALLDVTGRQAATIPTASFSARTSFAGVVIDNTSGDIFTASSSGLTRFVVKQNGNVGIGTSMPSRRLVVGDGSDTTFTNGTPGIGINNNGAGALTIRDSSIDVEASFELYGTDLRIGVDSGMIMTLRAYGGTEIFGMDTSGNIGINVGVGTGGTNRAALDVRGNPFSGGTLPTASVSGRTSFAALVADNWGVGDLFTASSGGITRFTIKQNGDLTIGNQTYTFPTSQGSSYILQTNGSGILSWIDPGSLPNSDKWDSLNGAIYPKTASVLDLLVGGTASNAAKFAVLNVNGSATPIASLSATTASSGNGNGIVLGADGTIQSLRNNTLTIGGNSTGNILVNPLGSITGGYLGPVTDSVTDLGTSTVRFRTIYASNDIVVNGSSLCQQSGTNCPAGVTAYWTSINNAISPSGSANTTSDLLIGGISSASARFHVYGSVNSGTTPVASIAAASNYAGLVVDQRGTGDILAASSGALTRFVIAQNGDVISRSSSSAGFKIQNADATQTIMSVDTANSNISLLANNSGQVSNWTATTTLPESLSINSSVTANGYVYSFANASGDTAYYNSLMPNGTLGPTWKAIAPPINTFATSAVVLNGYIYLMGGSDGVTPTNDVYFARLNRDGTIGSWRQTADLAAARVNAAAVTANGYIYLIGGSSNGTNGNTNVYYAKPNPDGSINSFSTTTVLPGSRRDHTAVVANGFMYVIGGHSGTAGTSQTTVWYGKINNNGTINSWQTGTSLPLLRSGHSSVVVNGYIYAIGGTNDSAAQSTVYYAKLGANGFVDRWQSGTPLSTGSNSHSSIVSNGYIYVIGESGDNVYSASTSRVLVGGTLDLIGLQGANMVASASGDLSLGTMGGAIIAGNGYFVGGLQVNSDSNFSNALNVVGALTTFGGASFQNSLGTSSVASVSGTTSFASLVVDNSGAGDIFTASSSGLQRFTIKRNGDITIGSLTYTFPSTQGTDYILQNNGSGVLSWIDPGSLPNSDKWDITLGAIYPKNAHTLDLLIGGTATNSSTTNFAKFAVLNVTGSGTPTASVSAGTAGGAYITATGNIATTAFQTLTLGSVTTGNILIKPADVTTGTTSKTISLVGGSTSVGNRNGGAINITGGRSTGSTGLGDGGDINITGGAADSNDLGSVGGNVTINAGYGQGGIAPGAINIGTFGASTITFGNATDPTTYIFANLTSCSSIQSNGSGTLSCGSGGSSNWDVTNGAIMPKLSSTLDFLIGGTATNSSTTNFAKFAVLNVTGSGTPTASVSAGTAGGAYLTATGTLATTAYQKLTIGGTNSSTGDIVIQPTTITAATGAKTLTLAAGVSTATSGTGGNLRLSAGNGGTGGGNGQGGDVFINAGANSGSGLSGTGGDVYITGGSSTLGGNAGGVYIDGGPADIAGNIYIGTLETTTTIELGGTSTAFHFNRGSLQTCSSLTTTAGMLGCSTSAGSNWNTSLGTISPLAGSNVDLLIGGVSSASARFHVYGSTNAGTTPVASIAAASNYAGLVVDQRGAGDLITASSGGITRFTVRQSGVVVIGNNTNGITFDYLNGGPTYAGLARPTKQIVLSPEYAGATLTASGAASAVTAGAMTSDASASATPTDFNFSNYYEWAGNSQTSLQEYNVAVRVTLPADFSSWAPGGSAMQIEYNTNLTSNDTSKLDVKIVNTSNGGVAVYHQAQASSAVKTWRTVDISANDLNDGGSSAWNTASSSAMIYLKMYAKDANYVQVGDIILNYLSSF